MKAFKSLVQAVLLSAAVLIPLLAQAQPAAGTTEAEVRKIDRENGKITLKHGAIKNLDMPAMTMVFQLGDARLLDKVKAGEKVIFKATVEAGKYTVTEMEPVK